MISTKKETLAHLLLTHEAVAINVESPFTFVSGIQSPVYCDNRLLIGFPETRQEIVSEIGRAHV